jgi:hypothetical protein
MTIPKTGVVAQFASIRSILGKSIIVWRYNINFSVGTFEKMLIKAG